MESHKITQITKSVGILGLATVISRVLGYIRDAYNAFLFGAGFVSDAFFVAYRIPNMLRDLLAEGALSSAFIPTFVEYLEKEGKGSAFRLANIVLNLLIILFSLIILIGIICTPVIIRIMAPGFILEGVKLTIKLTRILFPFIAFMGFSAIFMGMLNSTKHFTIPAIAPALGNIVMILSGIFICPLFGHKPDEQIIGWTIGALFSGLIQVIIQIPQIYKNGFRFKFIIDFKDSGIRKITKMMLPAIFSNSVSQINIVLVNTVIASILGTAAITYLYYGFRLMQLPLGIFGVAIATASFPVISSHVAKNEINKLRETLSFAIRMNLFITIPATFGLIVLSYPINSLLFQHGNFTIGDTRATANAAICYTLGLSFASCVKVLIPTFFALNDSKTPVKIGIIAIFLNVFFSIMLINPLGYKGLALASSISSFFNFTFLFLRLRSKVGKLDEIEILKSLAKIILASICMAFICWLSAYIIQKNFDVNNILNKAIWVFVPMTFGLVVYVAISFLFKVKESNIFLNVMKEKLNKNIKTNKFMDND
ncbi:MAG: murein biosynthesis integral membrane protein MurJ [Candidatus Firestonebacteria bacterium]